MYYIYKCVFVLLILRSSFSFEKKIFRLTLNPKRWIVMSVPPSGGSDLEMQGLFFTFNYLLWTQLDPKVHINKQTYRSVS